MSSNILDEIPYIVTPRKDTGLFNSKIAIWLFLASEVMLFGGLFSGYIFLRIYADYPWPERALPVAPGFINTFVLIGSSVTVVFAWAALKMRQWRQFQIYMWITIICAAIFMVLKGFEYKAKFAHEAARLEDSFIVVEGHRLYDEVDGNWVKREDLVNFEANSVSFDVNRAHPDYVTDLVEQSQGAFVLSAKSQKAIEDRIAYENVLEKPDKGLVKDLQAILDEPKLSVSSMGTLKELFRDTREHNAEIRTAALRAAWEDMYQSLKEQGRDPSDLKHFEQSALVNFDEAALQPYLVKPIGGVTFEAESPVALKFDPDQVREEAEKATMLDGTALAGTLADSPYQLTVDTLDFRWAAMKAEEKDLDPVDFIDNSWLIKNNPVIAEIWEKKKAEVAELEEELKERGQEPNENDRYRISWQEMTVFIGALEEKPGVLSGFTGPTHAHGKPGEEQDVTDTSHGYFFPELTIPRERIAFESNLTPKWNTYYAIYFLITGLHGLHVIGGAIVLGYYLFRGKKMYDQYPEWLANRVEVGGLFWHFVDLIWIFLFPIMYLM